MAILDDIGRLLIFLEINSQVYSNIVINVFICEELICSVIFWVVLMAMIDYVLQEFHSATREVGIVLDAEL